MTPTRRRTDRGGALKAILYFLLACVAVTMWGVYACTKKVVGAASDGFVSVQRKFDGEWDAKEREEDPAGYLRYLVERLEKNLRALESSRGTTGATETRLLALADENRAKASVQEQKLESLRNRYRAVQSGETSWPVNFEGEPVDETGLKSRVGSALASRDAYAKAAASLDQAIKQIESSRRTLPDRIEETKAKIAVLIAQEEIVRAGRLEGDLRGLLNEAGDVIAKNEAAVTAPVRTVEEVMRDAGAAPAAAASGVESWLKAR